MFERKLMAIGAVLITILMFSLTFGQNEEKTPDCSFPEQIPNCFGGQSISDCVFLYRHDNFLSGNIPQNEAEENEKSVKKEWINKFYGKDLRSRRPDPFNPTGKIKRIEEMSKDYALRYTRQGVSAGDDEPNLADPEAEFYWVPLYIHLGYLKEGQTIKDIWGGQVRIGIGGVEKYPIWDWNDEISSIEVQQNMKLTIYEGADYKGKSWTIVGPRSIKSLSEYGWNDQISSFKVCKYR